MQPDEVGGLPGVATPKDGKLIPSNAPGFGLEIQPEWIEPITQIKADASSFGVEYYDRPKERETT